ncbi:hypothetical protein ACFZAV_05665 [Streptomyces sp. NPDC008343]|uniref:hypothetical protein n=1 Tax=Streptomyces sp. NPDC008343 TaxID=3364828 RepID=UPI0036E5AAB2
MPDRCLLGAGAGLADAVLELLGLALVGGRCLFRGLVSGFFRFFGGLVGGFSAALGLSEVAATALSLLLLSVESSPPPAMVPITMRPTNTAPMMPRIFPVFRFGGWGGGPQPGCCG